MCFSLYAPEARELPSSSIRVAFEGNFPTMYPPHLAYWCTKTWSLFSKKLWPAAVFPPFATSSSSDCWETRIALVLDRTCAHTSASWRLYTRPTGIRSFYIRTLTLFILNAPNSVAPEPEGSSLCSQQPATGHCHEPDVSTPTPPPTPPISLRSILIPSSHLRLGLSSGLFPPGFPTKTLYTFFPSPMGATCPTHIILLD
jgi:hypothetical protein